MYTVFLNLFTQLMQSAMDTWLSQLARHCTCSCKQGYAGPACQFDTCNGISSESAMVLAAKLCAIALPIIPETIVNILRAMESTQQAQVYVAAMDIAPCTTIAHANQILNSTNHRAPDCAMGWITTMLMFVVHAAHAQNRINANAKRDSKDFLVQMQY